MSAVVLLITAPTSQEACAIADVLLNERLVACASLVPGLRSRYWWKGKIASAKEVLLIAKTVKSKAPAAIRRVKALHSYDVPEVLVLPVSGGNPDYLGWVGSSVGAVR